MKTKCPACGATSSLDALLIASVVAVFKEINQ